MSAELLKMHGYDYYQRITEDTPVELIDGIIYNMSPSPNFNHQTISGFLFREISNFLEGKSCRVFHAPFDVYLMDDGQDITSSKNIVQPDIVVICDKKKFHLKGCLGAPDFIIEIVSQGTKNRDYVKKLYLYNLYGVKEYWIVNPISRTISVYVSELSKEAADIGEASEPGFSEPKKYGFNDTVKANIFDGLKIDFSDLELLY